MSESTEFFWGGWEDGIMHKFNIQDNNSENVSSVNDLQMFPNLLILNSSFGLFFPVFCPKFYMHYYPWGFSPGHQTIPCALGSTQPLKMSTRIFLGVKMASA